MKRFWFVSIAPLFSLLALLPATTEAQQALGDLPRVEKHDHKSYTETIPGTPIKFEMIAVPGGTYLMGSPESEKGRSADEGPQRPVTVRPFWVGKFEVTWDEYDVFAIANPGDKQQQMDAEKKKLEVAKLDALSRPTPAYTDMTFGFGHDQFPALSMTHHSAMEYCRWLSQKTGKEYRLPTEAEWEWACRAGSKTAYSFGDDPAQLGDYAWFKGNSEEAPHKVGDKKPNAWGVHDMHGNVAEWCIDMYRKDYYKTLSLEKPSLVPFNPETGARYSHTVRGGSWQDDPVRLRSAARRGSEKSWNKQDPQFPKSLWWLTDADFIGFRIIRPVDDVPALKGIRSKVKWESQ